MQCICCKCGALVETGNTTLCLPMINNSPGHQTHCFCCAQPPRLKCIQCNMWRELNVMEEHGACCGGSLHVFVYSEPWPPFPEQPPVSPLRVVQVRSDHAMENDSQTDEYLEGEFQANEYYSDDVENVIDLSNDAHDLLEVKPAADVDVKPRIIKNPRWVTISEILQWTHCNRCGQVRLTKKGWLTHAQKCGQDPTYGKKTMFFIHLHTKSWCGLLVRDSFWDKHSHPKKGNCAQCRLSRLQKLPLPYQPKAPPRKNGAALEKRRQNHILKQRKKRRQTVTFERDSCSVRPIEDSIILT